MSDQFADAPDDNEHLKAHRDPTGNIAYIDDPLSESDTSLEEYDSEDEKEWRAAADHGVDDEDWEIAEKGGHLSTEFSAHLIPLDFTKQYNRIKQHNTLSSGTITGPQKGSILPAINRPKPKVATPIVDHAERKRALDKKVSDQLTALSKYTSRIASIDEPYSRPSGDPFTLGVSVNRKGPSAQANQKDKSDRATNEQVLDPRTRIILFKMIGRELLKEINGCVSTGKEVRLPYLIWTLLIS